MLGSRDVIVTIFITSMSSSKSLTSFACRFFHFRKPPGLRLTWPKGMENLAAFSARKVKRASVRERDIERKKYSSAEEQGKSK